MPLAAAPSRFTPSWRLVAAICAVVAAYHIATLPGAWQEWRAGANDAYPGQHYQRVLSHVSGLALVIAIPLPGLWTIAVGWARRRRALLWGVWALLMGIAVGSLIVSARLS